MADSISSIPPIFNISFQNVDFYDIKTVKIEFGNYIFTGFKMPTL